MTSNPTQDFEVFKSLYNEAPCGFLSTSATGTILRMNDYLADLIGYKKEELIDKKTLLDLITTGGKLYYETHYRPLITNNGEAREISFYLRSKDGRRIPVLINTIRKKINDETEEFLSTVLDTTQRKSYEKELLIAKQNAETLTANLSSANEELKRFAHVISHDIKTPITNIVMLIDFLATNFKQFSDEKKLELIEKIKLSTLRISDMTTRVLAYYTNSDLANMEPNLIVVKDLFEKVLEMCDPEHKIETIFEISSETITTYDVIIELVLLNLAVNALKYNDKEVVRIAIKQREDSRFYYFSVTDNGLGIASEHLASIFKPLKTLGKTDRFKQQGSGLGLSYVKKMVTELGGTISVSSDLGIGSTFSFTIAKSQQLS